MSFAWFEVENDDGSGAGAGLGGWRRGRV